MVKQGIVLEINNRLATVGTVIIFMSHQNKMEARVNFNWNDTGEKDGVLGSRLLEAIEDGSITIVG